MTLGALQAILGSASAVLILVNGMQQLDSPEVRDALRKIVSTDQASALGLTLDAARTMMRYTIMVMAVVSVTSLILGIYVLRRHRASRVALTVIGGLVALLCLAGGPLGWLLAVYIGVSLTLLWTRAARAWFSNGAGDERRPPPAPPPPYG